MGKREIHGATISFNSEHLTQAGYWLCNKCNSKTMLVSCPAYWSVDQETFKNGEPTPEDTPQEVFVGEVCGHWCPTCEILVSLSYNFK